MTAQENIRLGAAVIALPLIGTSAETPDFQHLILSKRKFEIDRVSKITCVSPCRRPLESFILFFHGKQQQPSQ